MASQPAENPLDVVQVEITKLPREGEVYYPDWPENAQPAAPGVDAAEVERRLRAPHLCGYRKVDVVVVRNLGELQAVGDWLRPGENTDAYYDGSVLAFRIKADKRLIRVTDIPVLFSDGAHDVRGESVKDRHVVATFDLAVPETAHCASLTVIAFAKDVKKAEPVKQQEGLTLTPEQVKELADILAYQDMLGRKMQVFFRNLKGLSASALTDAHTAAWHKLVNENVTGKKS